MQDETHNPGQAGQSQGSQHDYSDLLAAYHESLVNKTSDQFELPADGLGGAIECLRMMERNRQLTDIDRDDTTSSTTKPTSQTHSQAMSESDYIGRFEIVRRLGSGGSGIVFLARDPELERDVALKVPTPDALLRDEFVERFHREATVAAKLKHAHIVSVLETGSVGPISYIATEYCNGPDLRAWLHANAEAIPVIDVARLIHALADAVQHAHSRGILHRDIKPSNILFEVDDRLPEALTSADLSQCVRLADFGLARNITDSVNLTAPAAVLGTPAYMAPEQAAGETSDFGTHSDIFSLGVVFYELLTGVSPFERETALLTLRAVQSFEPAPIRSLRKDVPVDLVSICAKCLEKRPVDRYESAAALERDLMRFINGEPVLARPVSVAGRLRRWAVRKPMLATTSALALLMGITLAVGSTVAAIMLADSQTKVVRSRNAALDSLGKEINAHRLAAESKKLTQKALYEARLANAEAQRLTNRGGRRTEAIKSIRAAVPLIEQLGLGSDERLRARDEAIAALSLMDIEPELTWHKDLTAPAISRANAKANQYASVTSKDRHIAVYRAADGALLQTLNPGENKEALGGFLFSRNGRYLAARIRNGKELSHAQVWDLSNSTCVLEMPVGRPWNPSAYGVHCPYDFSHDSKHIIFANRRDVRIVDLESGKCIHESTMLSPIWNVVFGPNSQHIAIGSFSEAADAGAVSIFGVDQLSPDSVIQSLPIPARTTSLSWSPDGELIGAAFGKLKPAFVYDLSADAIRFRLPKQPTAITDIAFHPGERIMLTTGSDGRLQLWELHRGDRVLESSAPATHFTPDGHRVATRRGRMRFVSGVRREILQSPTTTDSGLPTVATQPGYPLLDVRPDGRVLVSGGNGLLQFWDLATSRPLLRLSGPFRSTAFDATGNTVLSGGSSDDFTKLVLSAGGGSEKKQMMLSAPTEAEVEPVPERWLETAFGQKLVGSRFVVVSETRTGICFVDRSTARVHAFPTGNQYRPYADVSPDGRFIAAGFRVGRDVHVWNAHTGVLLANLPVRSARVKFHPDGRTLAVSQRGNCSFYRLQTDDGSNWELVHGTPLQKPTRVPDSMAFSPDGSLVCILESSRDKIRLLDGRTFEKRGLFELPDSIAARSFLMTPDNRFLVVSANNSTLWRWDLAELQSDLAAMGLNWEPVTNKPIDLQSVPPIELVWKKDAASAP